MTQGYLWALQHFYHIHGVLDEYRVAELNRLGNRTFQVLWGYLLLSNLVALLATLRFSTTLVLGGLIGSNLLLILLVEWWLSRAINRLKLAVEEVDAAHYAQRLRALRWRVAGQTSRLLVFFWVGQFLVSWLATGWSGVVQLALAPRSWLVTVGLGLLAVYLFTKDQKKQLHQLR